MSAAKIKLNIVTCKVAQGRTVNTVDKGKKTLYNWLLNSSPKNYCVIMAMAAKAFESWLLLSFIPFSGPDDTTHNKA